MKNQGNLPVQWTILALGVLFLRPASLAHGSQPPANTSYYNCVQNGVSTCTNAYNINGADACNPYGQSLTQVQNFITFSFNKLGSTPLSEDPNSVLPTHMCSRQGMIDWNNKEVNNVCGEICEHRYVEQGIYWYQDAQGVTLDAPTVNCGGSDNGRLVSCGTTSGVTHPLTLAQLGWNKNVRPLTSLPSNGTVTTQTLQTQGQVQSLSCVSTTKAEIKGYCFYPLTPGIAAKAFVGSTPTGVFGVGFADILSKHLPTGTGFPSAADSYHDFDITFDVPNGTGANGMSVPYRISVSCGEGGSLSDGPGVNSEIQCNTALTTAEQKSLKQGESGQITSFTPAIVGWSSFPSINILANGRYIKTVSATSLSLSTNMNNFQIPLSSLNLQPGNYSLSAQYPDTNDPVPTTASNSVTITSSSAAAPKSSLGPPSTTTATTPQPQPAAAPAAAPPPSSLAARDISAQFSATAFVTGLYQTVLGRAPDSKGLAYWVGQLNNGQMNQGAEIAAFYTSAERKRDCTAAITSDYETLLGRGPDPGGLQYWMTQCTTNQAALPQIATDFKNSPEYLSKHPRL